MKISHLTPLSYAVSSWQGGTTTQIAIAPDGAAYRDRDFLWRISSASVEADSSDFTPLPEYDRLICVLRGNMRLTHGGGETVTLSPYMVYGFDGAADTRSEGRCVDFNLMTRKNMCRGSLEAITPKNGERVEIRPKGEEAAVLIYCCEGAGTVSAEDKRVKLAVGEAVLAEEAGGVAIALEGGGVFMLAQMRR